MIDPASNHPLAGHFRDCDLMERSERIRGGEKSFGRESLLDGHGLEGDPVGQIFKQRLLDEPGPRLLVGEPGGCRQRENILEGEMWKKPGASAMAFQATEDFAVEGVAFSWRARFPIAGPLAMTVVDELRDGVGQLRVSLLGIPLSCSYIRCSSQLRVP